MTFRRQRHYGSVLLILLILITTAACSGKYWRTVTKTPEAFVTAASDPAYRGPSFKKLVVFQLTEYGPYRAAIENAFTERFLNAGVRMVAGGLCLTAGESLKDKAAVINALQKGAFDGVLTVAVLNTDGKDNKRIASWGKSEDTDRIDLYSRLAAADPAGRDLTDRVRLEITLWEAETARKAWSGLTRSIDKFDIEVEAYPLAEATAAALREARLLRRLD